MTESNDIENKLRDAFTSAAPDNFDVIRSRCKDKKGKIIPMTEKNRKQNKNRNTFPLRSKIIAVAASFAILIAAAAGIIALSRSGITSSAAIVSLDVNPSIEISLNYKTDEVRNVNALNKDGESIIGSADFKGEKLDTAVDSLINSMLEKGYLNEKANSVLVSVNSKNSAEAERLQKQLSDEISGILNAGISNSSVLTQSVSADDKELKALADTYGITLGKAQLINAIIAGSRIYTFDSLAGCTINELNLLLASGKAPHESINAVGSASTEAYIGEEAALNAALADAGLSQNDVSDIEIEFDYDKDRIIYEVEFISADFEYEYEIDAVTGEILEFEHDPVSPEAPEDEPEPNDEYIGEEAALAAALEHAGVAEDVISDIETELEKSHGRMVYDVEFRTADYEYEYKIDALTGEVLKFDRDDISDDDDDEEDEPEPNENYIGKEAALAAALEHAGVAKEDAVNIEIELEKDHGRMVYDVEFRTADSEYEYTVDALTGEILESEFEPFSSDMPDEDDGDDDIPDDDDDDEDIPDDDDDDEDIPDDDDGDEDIPDDDDGDDDIPDDDDGDDDIPDDDDNDDIPEPSEEYIGEDAALAAALEHAGILPGSAENIVIKLENEDGRIIYEVDFTAEGYEYDYDIDALTGEIIDHEKEIIPA